MRGFTLRPRFLAFRVLESVESGFIGECGLPRCLARGAYIRESYRLVDFGGETLIEQDKKRAGFPIERSDLRARKSLRFGERKPGMLLNFATEAGKIFEESGMAMKAIKDLADWQGYVDLRRIAWTGICDRSIKLILKLFCGE